MAITKMRHVKEAGGSNGLKRSVTYIMNPAKTEEGLLIGGNAGTSPGEVFTIMMDTKQHFEKTGGRQGYHFVLSWKPGDITKELAYEVAGEFCERYLGDDYDYVYAVHTDQPHIHAHIFFNSINRRTGYKYRYEKGDWEKFIQPVTDEVCRRHGLPVLDDQRTGESSMSYAEHKAVREGLPTLTKIVRADIDRMILWSDSFEEFLRNMERLGYRIRKGKYITYYPPGFQKGRRDKNLGTGYSPDEIRRRISCRDQGRESSRVMEASTVRNFDRALGPYLSIRLPPVQSVYIVRIRRVTRYLDAKNPFAVKWRTVRKDAIEVGKLFEECMYLIDHDIHDLSFLGERERTAGRKEKKLIRRIRERNLQPEETDGGESTIRKQKDEVVNQWDQNLKMPERRS